MNKLTTAIILIVTMAGMVSCKKEVIGDGPITTQNRNVSNYSGISLEMNGSVYYTSNPEWKLEVIAKQSIHSMLETKVVNNKLVIRYSNGKTYDADETIRINVSGPDVNSLELYSSGSIYALNDINVQSLFLRSKGSGSISLQSVFANYLEGESLQSGTISANGGTVFTEKFKSDASGKINFSGTIAKYVTTRTIGSGDIKVKATDRLDVTIDGSGDVYFSGYPQISSNIHGSGRLIRF